jgi:hypothetical protein
LNLASLGHSLCYDFLQKVEALFANLFVDFHIC